MLHLGSQPNGSPEHEYQGSTLHYQTNGVCRYILIWGRSVAWQYRLRRKRYYSGKILNSISLFTNDCVECSTLTKALCLKVIIAAIIAPQHRAMKKNPTARRRFHSAHARRSLHARVRRVSVRAANNTDIRTSKS